MQGRKQLDNTIELTQNLKSLAQAYEQISVTKMQRARGKVFAARDYLNELSEIFADVRMSYRDEIEGLIKSKKRGKHGEISYSTLQKNGRSISVLLSSNSKLYGDIGRKVFTFFLNSLQKDKTDIFIIGRVGREMYDDMGPSIEYKFVEFPEGDTADESLTEILRVLGQYQTVTIYYGQFVNFLSQVPVESDVSGTQREKQGQTVKKKFFFEPTLQEILSMFENQIFASLFKQTLHESELSHVGARIRQMESALTNINQIEGKLNRNRRTLLKREEARKQLERLTGRSLWR